MNGIIKRVLSLVLAVMTAAGLGAALQTQNVLARLGGIGADISGGERLSMTAYDILHLGSLYSIFIAIAFSIAFLLGGLLFKIAKFGRAFIYAASGAAAMGIMLYMMKTVFFDIHILAGARDGLGIAMQMIAGAAGGFVFAKINQTSQPSKTI